MSKAITLKIPQPRAKVWPVRSYLVLYVDGGNVVEEMVIPCPTLCTGESPLEGIARILGMQSGEILVQPLR